MNIRKQAKALQAGIRSQSANVRPAESSGDDLGHVLSQPGCWCGQEEGHDWPGKDDGAPHPH